MTMSSRPLQQPLCPGGDASKAAVADDCKLSQVLLQPLFAGLATCRPAPSHSQPRSVQSVLDEMAAVLADSGRSMREMQTDTREEQREWWRARWGGPVGCRLLLCRPAASIACKHSLQREGRKILRLPWHRRLSLEDRLSALARHLGSSWLGPWR
jgi:hypothetical protein